MFTGLVAAVGRIVRLEPLGVAEQDGLRLDIDADGLDSTVVFIGDSIDVQGACMTVVSLVASRFQVAVSRESLNLSSGLHRLGEVNLKKSRSVGAQIGSYLVSGHVVGMGEV